MTDKPTLRTEDVEWRQAGDEVVVLHTGTGAFFTLNATAAKLWQGVIDGLDTDELATVLETDFGLSREQACADVDAFLAGLRAHDLLEPDA